MSNEHKWAKEPWNVCYDGHIDSANWAVHICSFGTDNYKDMKYFGDLGNAMRIVACVNFLAGHPDLSKVEVVSKEEIERLRKYDSAEVRDYGVVRDKYDQLRVSHAELLEAARAVNGWLCRTDREGTAHQWLLQQALTNAEAIK